jgi:hypothetical protein
MSFEVDSMKVPRVFDDVIQFVSGAMSRIFGPTDDAYPNTGVQPFEGEPFDKKSRSADW